jgi:membrane glycosyltransferase
VIQESPITDIAQIIELAVAPVFLLSGIGAMLAVMTNRLSRIVDRARRVESEAKTDPAETPDPNPEIELLSRRAKLIGLSIGLCTVTALLVSSVIAILFLGAFLTFDAAVLVAMLFIAAMFAFIAALLFFLREVLLATAGLRFLRRAPAAAPGVKRP